MRLLRPSLVVGVLSLSLIAGSAGAEPQVACTANGTPEAGFARLWNGVDLTGTRQAGPGGFDIVDDGAEGCRLVSRGGLGLLWFDTAQYDQFVLRAQFKTADDTDNSGIFVRFPNPGTDQNIPIAQGHEVQIREGVQGDGENQKTGSIYDLDREDARNARPAGQWNDYEIRYQANAYTITLNGTVVNRYTNTSSRGRFPGYIGLQNHSDADEVSFRNVRIQALPNLFTTIGITRSETRGNSQINGSPPYSLPAEEMPPSRTVGPAPNDTADDVPLRMPDTTGTQPNLAAFRGQTLTLRPEEQKIYTRLHFFGTTSDGGPAGGDFILRYDDGTTSTLTVQFPDWCAAATATAHIAIGPLTQRYRTTGGDTARCTIFHVDLPAPAAKKLVAVTLPFTTSPGSAPRQAYLMGLTLEEAPGIYGITDLSGSVQFPNDKQAPTTTHALSPDAPSGAQGWYAGPVRVTLTGTDEGGSGVEQMMYRVDGGIPTPYTGPFDFALEGQHALEYRSVDGAGNAEGYKSVTLKVDPNPPVTASTLSPTRPLGPEAWYDGAVRVRLTGADGSGSGVGAMAYRVDGGDWTDYGAGPIVVEAAGLHVVEYRATDVAGNEEVARSVSVKVDRTPPVTSARINGAAPAAEYVGAVRVAFTRIDGDGSGADVTQYRIGDGAWKDYTDAFDLTDNGSYRIDFRSSDVAGNMENFRSVTFVIRPPALLPSPPFPEPLPAPTARPLARLQAIPARRSTVAVLRAGKLAVSMTCQAVDRGTLSLTVSKAVAKRLGLKSVTLASRAIRCGLEGRSTPTLKPSSKVKRALGRAKGSITATLTLRLAGQAGVARDTQTVTLRGKS